MAEADGPTRLNVAEWQPVKQKSASPINSINVAAPSYDSHAAATRMVQSEGKTSTSEDNMERVTIQQPLLVDETNVHVSTPREPFPVGGSVLQKDEAPAGGTDLSHGRNLNERLSSLNEDDFKSGEEGNDVIDHEGEATLHEQRVGQGAKVFEDDEVRGEQEALAEVPSVLHSDSIHQKVHEDKVSHLPLAPRRKKCRKHRHHKTNRGGDVITDTYGKECKRHDSEETEDKSAESQNMASDIDKSVRRSDAEIVREGDATAVVTECSSDVSQHKTREQGAESMIGSSSSASYEGLKIVELKDRKHQSATSPEKAEILPHKGLLQEVKRSDTVKQKRRPRNRHSRSVKEQETVMRESEVKGLSKSGPGNVETDVMSELSTSYMSLPNQSLALSNIEGLKKLLDTVHNYQNRSPHEYQINSWLQVYISQLLLMSRKNVEDMDVSMSDTSTPDTEMTNIEELDRNIHHEVIIDSTNKKEKTQGQTSDAVKEVTNTLKEKTECTEDDILMLHLAYESMSHTRQAVFMKSVYQETGAQSYNEFRQSGTEIPSTSTPGILPTSHQITGRDVEDKMSRLEGSGRRDTSTHEPLNNSCQWTDNLREFNVETPPFASHISDMNLDEYKALKFPDIFSQYSEECTQRISNLSKKIDNIRGEKQKLVGCSGNGNNSANECDPTKYLSQSKSPNTMKHLSSKDNWHINTEVTDKETAASTSVPNADSRQQVSQNEENAEGTLLNEPGDKSETGVQQQQRSYGLHLLPPPYFWRQQMQRLVPSYFMSFFFATAV
jgi:hypothetical protein